MLFNLLKQFVKGRRANILFGKLASRVFDKPSKKRMAQNLDWLTAQSVDFKSFARDLDSSLWVETEKYSEKLKFEANELLNDLPVKLGGAGNYPLLYFITRYIKPTTVVETGVAAGFSSHAILSALRINRDVEGHDGSLFSSDFPYCRLANPEQYIGVIVPDELKTGWALYIDGDSINLPIISSKVGHIDLLHYDSDKSSSGRNFALSALASKLDGSSLIMMDDINDNSFFMEYCESSLRPFKVFKFEGKFVGLIGDVAK